MRIFKVKFKRAFFYLCITISKTLYTITFIIVQLYRELAELHLLILKSIS